MSSRAYSGIVSPTATQDLEAVGSRLRNFGPTAIATFTDAARSQLTAAWGDEIGNRLGFNAQQRMIVAADPQVVVAAVSGGISVAAATGGTGPLGFLTRPMEFGADHDVVRVLISKRGNRFSRHTRRQLPTISARGWIAYPAAGAWSSRVYKMALDIVVKVAHDAIDGGR